MKGFCEASVSAAVSVPSNSPHLREPLRSRMMTAQRRLEMESAGVVREERAPLHGCGWNGGCAVQRGAKDRGQAKQ